MGERKDPADEHDLEAVYRRDAGRLWRALVLSTGSPEVASDAVAEAFAQALRRGAGLDHPSAWVRRTAFRIAAGEMKRTRAFGPFPEESTSEMNDDFVDLWRALGELTPHQRTAVVLADFAGHSHREIARALGSTVAAVGVHVFRGRRRLRELLEDPDG